MLTQSLSDVSLLKEIQGGNHSAFSILVNRHTTRCYNMAFRYLHNQQDAEDIVQQAFLKLWKNPQAWKPGKAQFTTWFTRVIINLCLDDVKKRKPLSLPDQFDIEDSSKLALENLLDEERHSLVQAAIDKLPERQKTVLILCYFEQHSNKEAANILETTERAVQSLLLRAKDFLKKQLNISKL